MSFPIKQLNLPDLSQGIPKNKPSCLDLVLLAETDDQHQRRGGHIHGLRSLRPDGPFISLAGGKAFDRMTVPIADILPLATFA